MTPEQKDKQKQWFDTAQHWQKISMELEKCIKEARDTRTVCTATACLAESEKSYFKMWERDSRRKIIKAQKALEKLKVTL